MYKCYQMYHYDCIDVCIYTVKIPVSSFFVLTGVGEEIYHLEGTLNALWPSSTSQNPQVSQTRQFQSTSTLFSLDPRHFLVKTIKSQSERCTSRLLKYHWIIFASMTLQVVFFLHFAKWGHWCSSILANLTNSQTFETTEVWNRKTPIYKIGHFVHS